MEEHEAGTDDEARDAVGAESAFRRAERARYQGLRVAIETGLAARRSSGPSPGARVDLRLESGSGHDIEHDRRPDSADPADPADPMPAESLAALDRRLRAAAARSETTHAELLELLLRFDEARGWRTTGAKHCAAWMNSELGICAGLAWEKLRVARVLRERSLLRRLYRTGRLGWSKVRALARVVDADSETALCATALDATAAEVARMCEGLRTRRSAADVDDEIAADRRRFLARSGNWHELADGSVALRFVLPPDLAANAIGALEAMEDRLYRSGIAASDTDLDARDSEARDRAPSADASATSLADEVERAVARPSPKQRRADAFVMLAEQGLAGDERDVGCADRHRVGVLVDADVLEEPAPAIHADAPAPPPASSSCSCPSPSPDDADEAPDLVPLPLPARLMLQGRGRITASAVRRMLCDGTLTTTVVEAGEPIWVGRSSRTWPEPMRRAAIRRDVHCRFPGCTQERWLDVHHVVPWWAGGETSLENAVCLCRHHHRLIHDGGWVVERGPADAAVDEGWHLLGGASERARAIARRVGMRPVRVRFRRAGPEEATAAGTGSAKGAGAAEAAGAAGAAADAVTQRALSGDGARPVTIDAPSRPQVPPCPSPSTTTCS